MVADGMLTRKRYREVPPRVDYELTERARELMPVLAELARWGYEWAWSPPRAAESVDLGAIFRLAPGLIGRSDRSGTVVLTVSGERDDETVSYTLTLSPDRVTIEERAAEGADATVTGDRAAWVDALGPDRDHKRLEIKADARLAELLLEGLTATSAARAAATRVA